MVTLLAFNVIIEKSILNYFIAEESFKVTLLDGNISWCRYIFGDWEAPLQNDAFAPREAFDLLQNGRNRSDSRYISIEKTKPTHSVITVNGSPILFIRQGVKNLVISKLRGLVVN